MPSFRKLQLATALLAALSMGAPATLLAAPLTDKPGTAMAGDKDVKFLREAATAGHIEVDASKLAQQRASNSSVKTFAAQMIKDHGAADEKLKQIARKLGVQLPASPPEVKKQELAELAALNGPAFDAAYARKIGVDAHQEAVALFREASQDAKDDDVKAFARQTLPTLEKHLEMAKTMAAAVGK